MPLLALASGMPAKRRGRLVQLTPYQAWQSGNSWANMGQQCRFCDVMVYPFRRTPPEKPEDAKIDLNRPHPEELCEKCQALGYSCRSHRDY